MSLATPNRGTIVQKASATAEITAGESGALELPAGVTVRAVYAAAGQQLKEGDAILLLDLEQLQDSENAAGAGDTDGSDSSDAADSQSEKKLDENGTYTDKDEVAQYIYEYGHVPSNLTAADYDNADSMLPVEEGVTYQQCSLDDAGKQKLIFTQDAKRIYYTDDDGQSFDEIY